MRSTAVPKKDQAKRTQTKRNRAGVRKVPASNARPGGTRAIVYPTKDRPSSKSEEIEVLFDEVVSQLRDGLKRAKALLAGPDREEMSREFLLDVLRQSLFLSEGLLSLVQVSKTGQVIATATGGAEADRITTEEAAQLLDCSRPHVVKLIDDGELHLLDKVGRNRYLSRSAVLQFKEARRAKARESAGELTKLQEELGLEY